MKEVKSSMRVLWATAAGQEVMSAVYILRAICEAAQHTWMDEWMNAGLQQKAKSAAGISL